MIAARDAMIVLPVYNEMATVESVVMAVQRAHRGPILVVEDGSTDDTGGIVHSIDGVRVLAHERNLGYGRSLIDGFAFAIAAGSKAVVTMDCDGQHEPAYITPFLRALDGCDIVSGSRYLPASPVVGAAPAQRADVNRHVTESINRDTGWSLTDAFCGFKAYRTSALRVMTLTEPGYAMPLELWAEAYRAGLRVVELPVPRIYFDGDRSFGEDLDDPTRRLEYYTRVWERSIRGGRDG